jgi:hypothetical protein
MMNRGVTSALPKAKILGPGSVVTLEDAQGDARRRVRILTRCGRSVRVEPLAGSGIAPIWTAGDAHVLRAARPFGLFLYHAVVEGPDPDGSCRLVLSSAPARRKQLRHYFRMPVRLGVRVERDGHEGEFVVLRACNLSGNGILVFDPAEYLDKGMSVRLALPIGPAGEIIRLCARGVRVQDEEPRRVALTFEGIGEGTRQALLRFLVRQHRQHRHGLRGTCEPARVFSIERP